MALPIRLVVQFTPFPPGFQGDLNKFCRAFADRLEILSPFAGLTWQIGGIKPTSNVGPWLNDLGQPFVWNETLKDYVPMDLSLSLAGVEADVVAAQAAIVAFTALVGSYSTTAAMNVAIAAAVAGVAVASVAGKSAFKAQSLVQQDVVAAGAGDQIGIINLGTVIYDPEGVFSTGAFVAPETGFYSFTGAVYFATTGFPGGPSNNTDADFAINGVYAGNMLSDPSFSTAGKGLTGTADLYLTAGDIVTLLYTIHAGSGPGTVNFIATGAVLSGFRVR